MVAGIRGVLVVDRQRFARAAPGPLYARYRGIDGAPWPQNDPEAFGDDLPFLDDGGLAPLSAVPAVAAYVAALATRATCDVIALGDPAATDIVAGWRFIGFDVGYYRSSLSVFSVLVHEVAYGRHDAMRAFIARLNDHALLPTLDDVAALLAQRRALTASGADLEHEDGGAMAPVAIYVRLASP